MGFPADGRPSTTIVRVRRPSLLTRAAPLLLMAVAIAVLQVWTGAYRADLST
jgi:hypothetical protein